MLVLGARHLGGAVAERFSAAGWSVATVSLSEETARGVRERLPGALALTADARDPESLRGAIEATRERFGRLDAAVNAVSPRGAAPGSGDVTGTPPDALRPYAEELLPAAFHFLRACGGALVDAGGGTLVQVTGGSARRAMAGKAAWAAGAAATRALAHAAALELREKGVHVALLVVDGVIESDKTRDFLADRPDAASVSQPDVAAAVEYLVGQSPRGWTHELVITPREDRWIP